MPPGIGQRDLGAFGKASFEANKDGSGSHPSYLCDLDNRQYKLPAIQIRDAGSYRLEARASTFAKGPRLPSVFQAYERTVIEGVPRSVDSSMSEEVTNSHLVRRQGYAVDPQ